MATFKKITTLCILLDAFRWDYINEKNTPFLYALTKKGIYSRRLVSTAGFTQRSAVFSGTYCDTRNQLTAFIHDEKHSPFRFLKGNTQIYKLDEKAWWTLPLPSVFPFKRLKRLCEHKLNKHIMEMRAYINQEAKKYATHISSLRIPFRILPYFNCAEDATPIWDTSDNDIETIFGVMEKQDIRFEYVMYPIVNCEDERSLELLRQRVMTGADIYFATFTEADSVCHKYGTSTSHRIRVVNEIDRKMSMLNEMFEKAFHGIQWIVFGDHGMTDVVERFDGGSIVLKAAKKYRFRLGIDFLMFLDSTMIRLWHLNKSAEKFVKMVFLDIPIFKQKGFIINDEIAKRYRIPSNHSPCGNAIFWAHPGIVISPDYFYSPQFPPKGMHGYVPDSEDGKGFAVITGQDVSHKLIEEADLVDICPTLCDIVGMPYPRNNEGNSLVANRQTKYYK